MTFKRFLATAFAAVATVNVSATPQDKPPLPTLDAAAFADLKAAPPAADSSGGSRDWLVRWTTKAFADTGRDTFVVLDRRDLPVPMARERDPQLAADRLLIIAVDSLGATMDWRIVADPAIVRSEQPDATGLLSGSRLRQPAADFSVAIAADPRIVELRIYRPRWNGVEFVLEPLGTSGAVR